MEKLEKDKIKAIVVDLDGTTLGDDAKLTERTCRALRGCMAKGLRVIIATGRSAESAEPYRAALGAEGPMVYYNGSMVLDMPSRAVIDSHYIEQEAIAACADIARAGGSQFCVFLCKKDDLFSEILATENPSDSAANYSERSGLEFLYGELGDIIRAGDSYCIKGIFVDEEKKLRRVRENIHEKLGGKVTCVMSADYILEILPIGVSKASGMSAALKSYGLSPRDAIAFGDEENDIEMLSLAAYSVAPSNARHSAREAAKLTIDAHNKDGLAVFLEKT
ncbi:MAG: Cof-type HAD-IIB family hydrolase, partial [Spirochaetaceae bacterium]|nr:Cof-type HAD-IIB family hydrolase [Spirochaetaceae bacterium]